MAISKTQPMRPAEIELVDTVNSQAVTLTSHTNSLADLAEDIQAEARTRIQEDLALSDDIDTETTQRIAADSAITGIIGTGFDTTHTIAHSLTATNQQLLLLTDEVDTLDSDVDDVKDDLLTLSGSIADLDALNARIKIGNVANIVIPANDSISTSEVFAEAFEDDAECIVIAQVITSELATLFDFTLIDCTYSGFSYSIANSDADSHTVSLGYVAINTATT